MNRKLKLSLYVAAIFAAGILTGIFLSCQVVFRAMTDREKMAGHWADVLQTKLNLTPEQAEKIRPIIHRTTLDFSKNLSQLLLVSLSNCNAQVSLELTPDQKAKLEQLQRNREEFIRATIGGETAEPLKTRH